MKNKDLVKFLQSVANLQPATKTFNPGIGAGKLNNLIQQAQDLLKTETK